MIFIYLLISLHLQLSPTNSLAVDLAEAIPSVDKRYNFSSEEMLPHAIEALKHETENITSEILLSIAFLESRFIPSATTWVTLKDGEWKRVGGIANWTTPKKNTKGPFFCGVTQVAARTWKQCLALRAIEVSYAKAAKELQLWLEVCQIKFKVLNRDKKLRCALLGYGGGFPMIKKGTSTYPSRVIFAAKKIERARTKGL